MSLFKNLPFEWLVGLRYTRAGRRSGRNSFISFISLISMAGIALGVAALMAIASVQRLFSPEPIQFREAIVVAVIGLLVNVVCALILGRVHHHEHDHDPHHGHGHSHGHAHDDLNLRSAYLHVLADALTSVLAIVALVGGWIWGWVWLDSAILTVAFT